MVAARADAIGVTARKKRGLGGMRFGRSISFLFITFGPVALFWELFGRTGRSFFVPPLTKVIAALVDLGRDPEFWATAMESGRLLAAGLFVALVSGIFIGTVMGRYKLFGYVLDMYFYALMSSPLVAFVPVFVYLFGPGPMVIVATVFVFTFFLIALNTATGIRQADPTYLQMARSFGATESQILRKVVLPGAIPAILTGVRLGVNRAIPGLVTGEILVVIVGLGGRLRDFGNGYVIDKLYALIIFLSVASILLTALVRRIERRLLHWRPQ